MMVCSELIFIHCVRFISSVTFFGLSHLIIALKVK